MNPMVLRLLSMLRQPSGSTAMGMDYLYDSQRVPGSLGEDEDLSFRSIEAPEFDMESAKRDARRQSLGALGIALLEGAGKGDYTGSLARGLQGMAETRHRLSLENEQRGRLARQEARQAEEEERQERESRERMLSQQQSRDIAGKTFGRQEELWDREDQRRTASGRAAEETLAGIAAISGADSPEVRRAKALAELGEDADLDRLDKLYEDVIARNRFPEDARRKAEAEIAAIKARVAAGVEEDPLAPGRRAERGLDLQAAQLDTYRKSLEQRGADKAPTQAQFNDDVKAEADKLYAIKLEALKAKKGEPGKPRVEIGPDGKAKYSVGQPITEMELLQLRRQAEAEAINSVRSRYQGQRDIFFDSSGNRVE